MKPNDKVYLNTRKMLLGGESLLLPSWQSGPWSGWPACRCGHDLPGVIIEGLTATRDSEIKQCLDTLQQTHAGTGFIHEAFHKDDPKKFTRSGLWANTIFGELVWKTYQERPQL